MKKLLSVLAATSLITFAPLSVVACQKDPSKIKNFDYEDILSKFLGITELVFQQNLAENFQPFFYLSVNNAQNFYPSLDFDKLWEFLGTKIENGQGYDFPENSPEIEHFSKFVDQVIDLDQLNKDANQRITSNINFRTLLKNGKNPFTKSIEVKKVVATEKTSDESADNRILNFESTLTTTVEFLDATQNVSTRDINFEFSMTLFENEETADSFIRIGEDLERNLSNQYANEFGFESNSYNSLQISDNIEKLSNFEDVLVNDIEQKVLFSNENNRINGKDFKFEPKDIIQVVNSNHIVLAQQFTHNNDRPELSWKDDYYHRIELIKDIMKNGGETLNDGAKEISRRNSLYNNAYISKDLKKYLSSKDKVSSEVINSFNLWAYYDYMTSLKNAVSERKISLDNGNSTEKQRRVIGLYGTQIRDLKLTYTNKYSEQITLKMPVQFIVNHQLTSFNNTQELYDEYVKANLIFYRELFGFADQDVQKEDFDYTFQFQKPKKFDDVMVPDKSYKAKEVFQLMVEEALNKLELEKSKYSISSFKDYINGFGFADKDVYFKVDSDGYIYLYSSQGERIKYYLATSYSTGDYNYSYQGPDSYINFTLGHRDDLKMDELGNAKTPWKFKSIE
ncbi:hypothetical protein [Spiroplasma endosymbiont of Panorpa germanica]|uniref:hypothetical protein n=1 Tax=Spiroplasma endosymbiont of Panorpa germanica TaxID=3066314 RepID=UPI0030D52F3C